MRLATKEMIRVALRCDETVQPEVGTAILRLLENGARELPENTGKLLSAAAAARLLGVSRTSFWILRCEDASRAVGERRFPAVPLATGTLRYREKDVLEFKRTVTDATNVTPRLFPKTKIPKE